MSARASPLSQPQVIESFKVFLAIAWVDDNLDMKSININYLYTNTIEHAYGYVKDALLSTQESNKNNG